MQQEQRSTQPAAGTIGKACWKLLLPLLQCATPCCTIPGRQMSSFSWLASAAVHGAPASAPSPLPGSWRGKIRSRRNHWRQEEKSSTQMDCGHWWECSTIWSTAGTAQTTPSGRVLLHPLSLTHEKCPGSPTSTHTCTCPTSHTQLTPTQMARVCREQAWDPELSPPHYTAT